MASCRKLFKKGMFFEGLAVFFSCVELFQVEKSDALFACQVVVEPLMRAWGPDALAKEFLRMFLCADVFCVGALSGRLGGRNALRNEMQFDSTKGYPGEDGC